MFLSTVLSDFYDSFGPWLVRSARIPVTGTALSHWPRRVYLTSVSC